MRAIKTTTISILAVGLLAGSAVGVTAQDEADSGTDELLFALVSGSGSYRSGEFTGFGGIPAGTVTEEETRYNPPNLGAIWVVDPAPPGGDTFKVRENGQIRGELEDGTYHAKVFWKIQPFDGTGVYEGMTGGGEAFVLGEKGLSPVDEWTHAVYSGTVEMPAE